MKLENELAWAVVHDYERPLNGREIRPTTYQLALALLEARWQEARELAEKVVASEIPDSDLHDEVKP